MHIINALKGAIENIAKGTLQSRSLSTIITTDRELEFKDDFLSTTSNNYIDAMYESFKLDPKSVHVSWYAYFKALESGTPASKAFVSPPNLFFGLAPSPLPIAPLSVSKYSNSSSLSVSISSDHGISNNKENGNQRTIQKMQRDNDSKVIEDHFKIQLLVRAYEVRGHLKAHLDPLNIRDPTDNHIPELEPEYYGFTESDMDRSFQLGSGVLPAFLQEKSQMTLREIIASLRQIYCKSIGYEYIHIQDRTKCNWIRSKIEIPNPFKFTIQQKKTILDRLVWADSFERFVSTKWPNEKRFGLEGAESLIPGMKALIDRLVESYEIENIVMGMSHRGRLNVLANVVRKPMESIFSEFNGVHDTEIQGSGDVKYHLGMNYLRPTPNNKKVNLSLVANPSHLEAVDTVVLGKVKAMQIEMNDKNFTKSIAILLHGDAAFAGQGVVYEAFSLLDLPSYNTGGTIHLIVNNQIGFTTDPRFARSTPYCSDIAKMCEVPVFHVNADDPEAVVYVCMLAADWRSTFHTDVVIDLVCYRRHGHNEIDQPSFTQPRMYSAISKQKPVLEQYISKLEDEGKVSKSDILFNRENVWKFLEKSYQDSKSYIPTTKDWLTSNWNGFKSPKELQESISPSRSTGVDKDLLLKVGMISSSHPKDFDIHPGVGKIMENRIKTLQTGKDIDMPTAEALAFGTLLCENIHVRLSGQDVERGTFSQRHAVFHNQKMEEGQYVPLQHLSSNQAKFVICNSSLSEFGIMGFELGYSLVSPYSLVLWEAQFGDFSNNAQCIIDQFISSGESKWLQRSGLTLLLPHGYDGAGPEHSNARIERFLSLCDDHPYKLSSSDDHDVTTRHAQDCNIQVVYPTTPANYFHVLRRQTCRDFRKPLIVFNSKSLLRHPLARSELKEFEKNTWFSKVIGDAGIVDPKKVDRIIICSGQVYYTLLRARELNATFLGLESKSIALIRLEQLAPFPSDQIVKECDKYPNASTIVWCQEEPLNLGPWFFVESRLETSFNLLSKYHKNRRIKYAGREPTASVATGFKKQHRLEEFSLLASALIDQPDRKPQTVDTGIPLW